MLTLCRELISTTFFLCLWHFLKFRLHLVFQIDNLLYKMSLFIRIFSCMYYGGQKISAVIFPSFQKNRCSPFLIVIMIDVFTCHF
jgi:hypothetical protein